MRVLSCLKRTSVIRIGFETADDGSFFTHDIEYHIEPGPVPRVSLFRICFHQLEHVNDLERIVWDVFEGTVLRMDPVPDVEIHVVDREQKDIFKWLVDAICEGRILTQLYARERLEVGFPATDAVFGVSKDYTYVSLEEIQARCSEYDVNGRTVVLKESQRFELMMCDDEDQRRQFLEAVHQSTQAGWFLV